MKYGPKRTDNNPPPPVRKVWPLVADAPLDDVEEPDSRPLSRGHKIGLAIAAVVLIGWCSLMIVLTLQVNKWLHG